MIKQYVALARVSSREQQREGFSLEVQEEALKRYAQQHDGQIVQMFRIAETATKPDERRTFKVLLAYVKENARNLDGLLFFKVDRAARNLFDYVELERLEDDYEVPVIYITQPTENTPAGRMMRRTLANMASFYTEQQSLDVREGQQRRVESGLFPTRPPYGYRNLRVDGRSIIEVDPEHGAKIPTIFHKYAHDGHSLDSLIDELAREGIAYTKEAFRFTRSKLHSILRDRGYIGDIWFRGQWHRGSHKPLVDTTTFQRVQVRLGDKTYESHELVYGSELVTCSHCGRPVTGERKTKQSKSGPRQYTYYRCTHYSAAGHPRHRVPEGELDQQVLDLFASMRIEEDGLRNWFGQVLQARRAARQQDDGARSAELERQLTSLRQQHDRLLNLRLQDEVDQSTFATKSAELRDRTRTLEDSMKDLAGGTGDSKQIAEKAFELSQSLTDKWLNASVQQKRQLLEIVCLNFSLDGVTLVPTMRKPFDILVEGPSVLLSRGNRI